MLIYRHDSHGKTHVFKGGKHSDIITTNVRPSRCNRVDVLIFLQSYKYFQFIPFFLTAILNFLLISMSGISGDCTVVFFTSKNMGLAVRIVPISHLLGKLQVFRFFYFPTAIFDFQRTTMSHIIAGCTSKLPIHENMGIAVGIMSKYQFLAK